MTGYMIAWLVAAVAFAVAEAFTAQIISVWFMIGSLIALIFAALGVPPVFQLLVFAVSAAILLLLTRPLVKRYLSGRITPTNADRAIGQTALVLMEIGNGAIGQVKVNGLTWSAVSEDDGLINKGERVTVKAIEGVKLIVERMEAPEPKPEEVKTEEVV